MIEKLGITPAKISFLAMASRHELQDKIVELEQQRNRMGEALLEEILMLESEGIAGPGEKYFDMMMLAIEKVSYPKKWPEIKTLIAEGQE